MSNEGRKPPWLWLNRSNQSLDGWNWFDIFRRPKRSYTVRAILSFRIREVDVMDPYEQQPRTYLADEPIRPFRILLTRSAVKCRRSNLYAVVAGAVAWLTFVQVLSVEAGLVAKESTLNFGEVWAQSEFAWKVELRNDSDSEIRIREFEVASSCCRDTVPAAVSIPPKQSKVITLPLDLVSANRTERKLPQRQYRATVMPIFDDGSRGTPIAISGTVRNAFYPLENPFYVGEIAQGDQTPIEGFVVHSHSDVRELRAKLIPMGSSVQVERRGANPKEFELRIVPPPKLDLGRFRWEVELQGALEDGTVLPAVRVPVYGRGVSDVAVTPPASQLGVVAVGSTLRETFVVASRNGRPFVVETATIDGQAVSTPNFTSRQLSSGKDMECAVALKSDAMGSRSRRIEFRVRYTDGAEPSELTSSATLSYHGIKD